jgi:hypothetical protein
MQSRCKAAIPDRILNRSVGARLEKFNGNKFPGTTLNPHVPGKPEMGDKRLTEWVFPGC